MTKGSVTSEKFDTTRVQCESKSQRNNESRRYTGYKHRLRDKFKKSQAGTTNTLHMSMLPQQTQGFNRKKIQLLTK